LIAEEPECLWFAEDGKFSRDGRTSKLVLESLMGKDGEGAGHLHDFTLLIPQYAALNFSAQCVLEPGVIGANVDDRQTGQIARILEQRCQAHGGELRILDFGAGKGRLLPTLGLYANAGNRFDYFAYNKFPDGEEECKQQIRSFYKSDQPQRYFDDLLPIHEEAGRFDVIIMCNVLHEVDPDTWLELFGAEGALCSLLATDGALLIVEDYGINVGERAHRYGFLLMDSEELTHLFKIEEKDHKDECFVRVTSSEQGYENRLTAHLINQRCVARVSDESRKEAIQILLSRMQKELAAMLEKEPTSNKLQGAQGRDYARSSQLFVNASLWLAKKNGGKEGAAPDIGQSERIQRDQWT
jgi:SAM-dependent methyltransferase